ncbi:MAG: hypothetical protein GEU80_06815 [Dehalococcoidia bacterium]|nr:hypothetical protein [Dehalococcoidia bacterium]
MPSLGSHMTRARLIAERLRLPEIDADRGSFYFGASAPDVRVITRLDRRVTHFYELDEYERQDSVERMFRENPALALPAGLDTAAAAFMAGYLTHLVLDEAYIEEIYRPRFGVHSDIAEEPRRNVLDRALQYEIDLRDREDREAMADIGRSLAACSPVAGIPFIQDEHLQEWSAVVLDVASHAPDYARFKRMMSRHLAAAGLSGDEIDRSCEDPEALVREAFERVTPERIEEFWEDSAQRMYDRVWRYLR